MSGWHILTVCAVCGLGTLVFLRLVAAEIELATAALEVYEKKAGEAHEKRRERAAEVVTAGIV